MLECKVYYISNQKGYLATINKCVQDDYNAHYADTMTSDLMDEDYATIRKNDDCVYQVDCTTRLCMLK